MADEKVNVLQMNVFSYVRWIDNVVDELGQDPQWTHQASYAFLGENTVYEELTTPIEGKGRQSMLREQGREEELETWKTNDRAMCSKILSSHIDPYLCSELRQLPGFREARVDSR